MTQDTLAERLAEQYDDASTRRPLGPRPADSKPLTMQQAILRCHYQGISASRANVNRLMGITEECPHAPTT